MGCSVMHGSADGQQSLRVSQGSETTRGGGTGDKGGMGRRRWEGRPGLGGMV